MKATELMIGDWVQIGGEYVKITDLISTHGYGEECEYCFGIDYSCNVYADNKFSPVPITEEILKANGFAHEDGEYCWEYYCGEKDYFILHCGMNGEPPYSIEIARRRYIPNIESVHELQHALRVCGLNELADNFKIK